MFDNWSCCLLLIAAAWQNTICPMFQAVPVTVKCMRAKKTHDGVQSTRSPTLNAPACRDAAAKGECGRLDSCLAAPDGCDGAKRNRLYTRQLCTMLAIQKANTMYAVPTASHSDPILCENGNRGSRHSVPTMTSGRFPTFPAARTATGYHQ